MTLTTQVTPTAAGARAASVCDREDDTVAFVRQVFVRLGEKWTMPVLDRLASGPVRFTGLMGVLSGISHRVLTATLRTLEQDGLVSRTSYPESPPRVEYALTPLGDSFLTRALQMVEWAQDHRAEIEANRAAGLG